MTLTIPFAAPLSITHGPAPVAAARAPTRRLLNGFELVTLISATCILSGGFIPLGRFMGLVEVLDPGVSDPWANALQGFIISLMSICVVINWRKLRASIIDILPLLLVWSLCIASTLWSADPTVSVRRSILLMANLMYGPFAVAVAGPRGAIRAMNYASWFMITISIIFYVAWPSVGQDVANYAGAFRGVFAQKNSTAWALTLALSYLGYSLFETRRVSKRLVAGGLIILACIVLSKSTTEALAALLLIAFWGWSLLFRNFRSKAPALWVGISLAVIAATVMLMMGDDVYAALGKDPGLTGRADIWRMARQAIAVRPILGWGYQGFWTPFNPEAVSIWTAINWQAPHAHNGILEVLIEVGYLGLALFFAACAYLLYYVARSIARGSALGWWTLSWMLLLAFRAHSESAYLQIDMSMSLLAFSTVALRAEHKAAAVHAGLRPYPPLHLMLRALPGMARPR